MNEWNPEAYYAPLPEREDGPDEPDLRTEDDDWWQALDEDKEEQERLRADIERKDYEKLDETNLDEQQRQSLENDIEIPRNDHE